MKRQTKENKKERFEQQRKYRDKLAQSRKDSGKNGQKGMMSSPP
jgi:hypothetical protein